MQGRRQTGEILALLTLFFAILVMMVVGFGWQNWAPEVASEHGAGVDGVIRYLVLATGAVLIFGTLALMWFVWKYGRGKETGTLLISRRTEILASLLPVIAMALIAETGVLLKGLPVWEQVYGETPDGALVVEVTGKQFEWIVRYPGADGEFGETEPALIDNVTNMGGLDPNDPAGRDDIVIRNQVHVVVGRPVALRLRARDVLHSFSVPAMRIKQDAIPGSIISTHFVPTRVGEFEIACAELCGMGHYRMRARIVVHEPADFDDWLAERGGIAVGGTGGAAGVVSGGAR